MSCLTFSSECVEALRADPAIFDGLYAGIVFYALLLLAFYAGFSTSDLWQYRREAATALRDIVAQRCAGYDFYGSCWCRSASTCLLYRCNNCDMPVDETGHALLDDFCMPGVDRSAGPCPLCCGPMRKP